MKVQTILALGLAASADAHAIWQRLRVNGADQGSLVGFRAPSNNNPVTSVSSGDIVCGASGSRSNTIINVPAGATVGTWLQHVIGGPQFSGDPDNPIASSHKGPVSVYYAKVSNAATTSQSGLSWFKVAHEGFSNGRWAVDTLISNGGWWSYTVPSCLAPGNYLVRIELIALHSAGSSNGAQFYTSCVQINITGGGNYAPGSTVSFPGAYPQNDPGVLVSIYGSTGKPDMGGRSYPIPGPAPISCNGQPTGGNGNPTTTTSRTTPTGGTGTGAPLWGQCGGIGFSGPTTCASGRCVKNNDYYSQCQP